MIFSTLKNITKETPLVNKNNLACAKFLYSTNQNSIDGGLRRRGLFKKSYENIPLITIVTVVYNNKDYIEKTILSVLKQNYNNIEYIIIDGNSNDGTLDIIKKYGEYIDYYISEKDNGIYDAMNKGLSLSTGDYILMLNSGDYLKGKNIIRKVVKRIIKHKYPHILYGRVYYFNEKNKFVSPKIMNHYYLFTDNSSLPHQATFISKKAYNLIGGYDLELRVGSDAIWTYNAKLFNFDFKYINLVVSYYQMGGHSSKKDYLLEIYGYLYNKGIWNKEKFRDKLFNTFNIKERKDLEDLYKKEDKIVKKYNLEDSIDLLNRFYYDILIVNEDHSTQFNKNLINILSLAGYSSKYSCIDFFLNIKYRAILIEWEDQLLYDGFYPPNTTYEEKFDILSKILENYKKSNTKIIGILHNKIDHQCIFDEELYKKNYEFKKFIYSKCDAMIHLGYEGMKDCIDFYDLHNIKNYVIPHSLYTNYNIQHNKIDSKKYLRIKDNCIVIGCLGAIRHQEEYDLLLKSFDSIKILNKFLLLIGNHRREIKFKKRGDCIIISDFLKEKEFAIYLNACDIIFLPRLYSLNSAILFLGLSYSKIVVGPETGNIGEYLRLCEYPTYKREEEAPIALQKAVELLKSDPDIVYKNRIKIEESLSNYQLSLKFKEIFSDLKIIELTEDEKILSKIINYHTEELDKIRNKLERITPIDFRIKDLLTTLLIKISKKLINLIKLPYKIVRKIFNLFRSN